MLWKQNKNLDEKKTKQNKCYNQKRLITNEEAQHT